MSTSRYFNAVVAAVVAFAVIITVLFMNGEALGLKKASYDVGYLDLFDDSRVHTIDVSLPDWDGFIAHAASEEYTAVTVTIDGERVPNVGFRAKGNGSLFAVTMMSSPRFSWKIEFDRFEDTQTYHGLDKLCLNNLVEDATFMKDHLVYRTMARLGVPAPLCSYVFLTVNGEPFGLYEAVEGIEDGFITRNFGRDKGRLYKPDNASITDFGMGADMNVFALIGWALDNIDFSQLDLSQYEGMSMEDIEGGDMSFDMTGMYGDGSSFVNGGVMGGAGLGMMFVSSDDLLLKYIDDDPASYPNVFGKAKMKTSYKDEMRLIGALKNLSERDDLEETLDTDEVIRYFAAHNFFVNSDSYTGMSTHNYYLYERDGVLSMLPWDYNLGYGTMLMTAHYAVNDPIDEPMAVKGDGDHPMFEWITADEGYKARYYGYLSEVMSTDFDSEIDEISALIRPYIERDPTKFVTLEEFDEGCAMLKEYLSRRSESVRGQLSGEIPATKAGQAEHPERLVSAEGVDLHALGDVTMGIADERQDVKGLMGNFDFSALEGLFRR
ncbi:MAG: CotH kinase family protein [Oscillospiraceae bacterium]|nr:CotH kinase family protein [Oscillospiraceae bacterium]